MEKEKEFIWGWGGAQLLLLSAQRRKAWGGAFVHASADVEKRQVQKYEYDPLMREPRCAPPLHSGSYDEEDFKL